MAKTKSKGIRTDLGLQISNSVSAGGPAKDKIPSEDAFSKLKNRIEATLQKSDENAGQKARNKKNNDQRKGTNNESQVRGKKRGHDGTILDTKARSKPISDERAVAPYASASTEDEELRAALKELGGTEEDLLLMADAASESEMEGFDEVKSRSAVGDRKGIELGISNILKEIALAKGSNGSRTDLSAQEEDSDDNSEAQGDSIEGEEIQAQQKAKASGDLNVGANSKMTLDSAKREKKFGHGRLKCEPRPDWYTISAEIDITKDAHHKIDTKMLEVLHTVAKALLDADNEAFKTQQQSSSQVFYNTVIASGTLSDKISALTLAVQESPVHNVKALETLVILAGKRSRGQAIDVLRALKDLFAQGSLLPPDRRLYNFSAQPALLSAFSEVKSWSASDRLPQNIDEEDLVRWAFEDWLKTKYFEVLKILEIWCNDEIEFSKSRAISYIYELLKERPEQESNLLRLLINKLGDPTKKIASQTSYLLMQLLINHPAMKMVVISAVEADFLFRPGQSTHSKHYAVTTLNQTALSAREEDVANKLLDIYFALFAGLLKSIGNDDAPEAENVESTTRAQRQRKQHTKKNNGETQQDVELREKLISAILTGVNRAYPYAGADQKGFDKHLDTLFRITHSANFNTGVQAMLLIQQLTSTHGTAADRFYRTLYESLLDPRLISASKQQLYLNLLHRSLKADLNVKRVKAFVKRILQILSLHDASFVCGSFFLLKDLQKSFPSLCALLDQAEQIEDDEEEFHDVSEVAEQANSLAQDPSKVQTAKRYDSSKRAPEYANADNSCAWEVLPFLAHFHPSVNLTAEHYLQQEKLPGKPDLSLHTLIHFLDRFVYRNPKLASNRMRGTSIMQPMAASDTRTVLINSTSGKSHMSVNTEEFRSKKATDVSAEDVFFHKYFKNLGKEGKPAKKREQTRDGSANSDDEDAVWKAMMDSAPDLEHDSNDEDIDMSSLEDAMSDLEDIDAAADSDLDTDDQGVDIEAGIFEDMSEESNDGLAEASEDAATESEEVSEGSEPDLKDTATQKSEKDSKSANRKRQKLRGLPTFASAADYAKMLDDDDDEDMG